PHGAGSCANSASSDCLEIFEFKVDWNTPANSTVSTSPHTVSITEFDSDLCGLSSYSCIPQSGSSVKLDPLREVVMQRLQYRNFGSHESLVGNLSTDVVGSVTGNDRSGIRWFELRKIGNGNWTLYQEGTYSPDAHSRWMGSAALDQDGNMAVAYNVSSSSIFPGLRYAGRLANDPLGTLLQGEGLIIDGSGANGSIRYGDYSQLNVDPADDCTFWFTGQYNPSSQWSTRIATFKFDSCGQSTPNFTITPALSSIEACHGSAAQYILNLSANGGFNSPVTLSTSGLAGGSNFSINPVSSFPSSSQLNVNSPALGTHNFNVIATGGALSKSTSLQLNVLDDKITIPQSSILPAAGSILQSEHVVLSWSLSTSSIANLTVEVATDAAFTNIIASASNLTTNQYQLSGLQAFTNYYWRVTGDNACGNITSPTYGFMTTTISDLCNTSTLAIPDNSSAGIVSSQTISQNGTLSDLNVSIELTHTYVGDLVITLEHADSNSTVTIIDKPTSNGTSSCGGNNISAIFDDAATNIAETTCSTTDPALSGLLKPNGTLSSFNGDNFAGTWNLKVSDLASNDIGSITQWCLTPDGAFMDFNADLSDLASSYGIAAHKGNGALSIGTNWTSDTIANQGQDSIDDDGLFIPNLAAGQTDNVVVAVSGTPSGANAWLQAWFDWNHNGIFDSGELVFNSAVSVGSNSLSITPPSGFDEAYGTNYRFRLFDSATQPAGAPNPQGVADQGEVTDGGTPFAYISYLPIMSRD
ncbi:MAG: GEVED domain-containing protein, partial [Candidatus Promineifilaceae bacterium]